MGPRRSLLVKTILLLAAAILAFHIPLGALAADATVAEPVDLETCTASHDETGTKAKTCANIETGTAAAAAAAESGTPEASSAASSEADDAPSLALPLEPAEGERRVIQLSAWSPRAYLFKRFLSDEECDHIVAKASPKLERSQVVDGTDGHISESTVRTSSGMFMDKGEDEVIKRIEQRIALWTFLPIANQESLQVLRYGVGQKYDAHHDYFDDPVHLQRGGHRYATVLMYLNNVTKGGETTFPQHKDPTAKDDSWSECGKGVLGVRPIKGDALLFFNMLPDGTPDDSSLHHACPVVEGEKWSAPKWIHVGSFDEPAAGDDAGEEKGCVDTNAFCEAWAEMGECERNKEYMVGSQASPGACRKSCNACAADVAAADAADGADAGGEAIAAGTAAAEVAASDVAADTGAEAAGTAAAA